MTESDWETCESPRELLGHCRKARTGNNNMRRKVGIACCRFALAEAGIEDEAAWQTVHALECQVGGKFCRDSWLLGASDLRDKKFGHRKWDSSTERSAKVLSLPARERAQWNALDAVCILEDHFGIDLPDNDLWDIVSGRSENYEDRFTGIVARLRAA